MINMIGGGGWFGGDTRVFYKKFEGYYSKNQKKGWMRLIFIFLFLEEGVCGRADCVIVLFSQKYIYFWELMFPEITKRLDLTS